MTLFRVSAICCLLSAVLFGVVLVLDGLGGDYKRALWDLVAVFWMTLLGVYAWKKKPRSQESDEGP